MAYQPPLLPFVSFPANPPTLPVRTKQDSGELDHVVRATLRDVTKQGIQLGGTTKFGRSVDIHVEIIAPGTVHVLLQQDADPQRVVLARRPAEDMLQVACDSSEQQLTLRDADIQVRLRLDPFHLTFCDSTGRVLLDQNYTDSDVTNRPTVLPFGFSLERDQRVAFHDTFTVEPDEHFYGFGEKFTELDKRGQRLEMWNYDAFGVHSERAYKNVPFFLSTRGYGMFVDSVRCINFDVAASNHAVLSVTVPDSALDYYVIAAPDLKDILTRYARLVSFPTLPPKWAFGLWMSSGFKADSGADVIQRAAALRENELPCDIMHLDAHWQRFGCWSDMVWDRQRFPNPEALIAQIKALGFKVSLWMNPYLGIQSERFAEANEHGYLIKTRAGEPFIADLWSGDHPPVGIIDMTNPEAIAWFQAMLRPLLRMGVDVFKTDFGEGVPVDAIAHNGMTGEQLHNLYPLLYNDAVAEITSAETGRAGLVWGRSTYAGGQRHAAQWGGDPNCTFQALASTLRGGLSFGLSGHAFWSHDIGGFHGEPTREVYVRWAQFGLFSPLVRAHGTTSRLPWDFGDEALRIVRAYARLRYRLLPYLYSYAHVAVETGVPMMRAMVLEFPDDPNTHRLDLQYLFGREFLVAPVYNASGLRHVYFPAGRWVDFWSHEVIEGPQTRAIHAPLDQLPLYVRANALIPTIEPQLQIKDDPFDLVTFDAYLLDHGSFNLYDVDGTTHVSATIRDTELAVAVRGSKRAISLRLLPLFGVPLIERVLLNERELPAAQDGSVQGNASWTIAGDRSVYVQAIL